MMKNRLFALLLPLLLTGCAATFSNLTPQQQPRNPNSLYRLEVAFTTRQHTLRWETIQPKVVVGMDSFPMRPTPLMTNRWETLLPIPPGTNLVHYRYKFDFDYNALGRPKADSAFSPPYTLRIVD
jgi:hypothetical protein